MKRSEPCAIGRGVYFAAWTGRNGETLLLAVDSGGRLVGDMAVPKGIPCDNAIFDLWERLDHEDPEPPPRPRLQLVTAR